MNRPVLEYGSKGKHVTELQELLNKWIIKEDGHTNHRYCKPDGDFGSNTRDIVRSFQVSSFLRKDGVVGNMSWSALLGIEMYNCFDLPMPLVLAPNQYQCWAGATAMLLKQGIANTTEPAGVKFEKLPGGATGGLDNSHENIQKFAKAHNLQMLQGEAMTCLQLTNLIDQNGRLMLNIKGINSSMKNGSPDDSHLLNLVGARGNGQPNGTTITLYNPSGNIGDGSVIIASYKYLKWRFPKLSYQVFYNLSNRSTPIN